MDNQAIAPELCCKNDRQFKIAVIILGILIVLGLFGNIYLLLRKEKQTPPIAQPVPSPAPTQILATPTIDLTANWKTYEGVTAYSVKGNTKFSIKYPYSWALKGKMLYPLGDITADIQNYTAPYLILGTGGHGGGCETTSRIFPAGEAEYCWGEFGGMAIFNRNEVSYIFEAYYYGNPQNLSNEEYETIFGLILYFFRFLD